MAATLRSIYTIGNMIWGDLGEGAGGGGGVLILHSLIPDPTFPVGPYPTIPLLYHTLPSE